MKETAGNGGLLFNIVDLGKIAQVPIPASEYHADLFIRSHFQGAGQQGANTNRGGRFSDQFRSPGFSVAARPVDQPGHRQTFLVPADVVEYRVEILLDQVPAAATLITVAP